MIEVDCIAATAWCWWNGKKGQMLFWKVSLNLKVCAMDEMYNKMITNVKTVCALLKFAESILEVSLACTYTQMHKNTLTCEHRHMHMAYMYTKRICAYTHTHKHTIHTSI